MEHFSDGRTAVTGRLHERVFADVVSSDHRPMRVRVFAERCDNPGDTAPAEQVVLHVEREPLPAPLSVEQVARLTDGLSDEACRQQLALFLAGAYDSLMVVLPPRHRRVVAAALLAVDTLGQPGRAVRLAPAADSGS
jgi:hypothetical protein